MSHDELSDIEQLDGLTGELVEAGRVARVATANREQPDPLFAARLRASLMSELPAAGAAPAATATASIVTNLVMPPAHPIAMPDRLNDRRWDRRWDRRSGTRPLMAAEVQEVAPDVASAVSPTRADLTRAGRRWLALDNGAATGLAAAPATPIGAGDDGHVVALKPSMRWHIPTSVLPSRWIGVGLAASIAAASLIYGSGVFMTPKSAASAGDAVAATLIRGGTATALVDGMQLRENDEIKVGSDGRATLQLGGSYVRMAPGSDVQLQSLDASHLVVGQIAGRAYHRVVVPAGGTYEVTTATVTWKAVGTAFDVDRELTAGGGEQVRGLALYDGLDVTGPGLRNNVAEGSSATIVLRSDGAPAGSAGISPITSQTLADTWLIGNAAIDARLGLPLGQLAAALSPSPTAAPTATQTPAPTPAPVVATPKPTAKPTPKPTAKPAPPGRPNLGTLKIKRNADSSYTFTWPKYTGEGFLYYKLMHGQYPSSPSYGTSGDYWACNDTAAETSWTGFIDPGNYSVRLQVVDDSGSKVLIRAETPIVHLKVSTLGMGPLTSVPDGPGSYTFNWSAYTGATFDFYKIVYEDTSSGHDPSYPGGSRIWAAVAPGSTTSGPISIPAGDYKVRVQAIGWPSGYSCGYAYAQTTILHLIVP